LIICLYLAFPVRQSPPHTDNWHSFLLGTLGNIEATLLRLNVAALFSYVTVLVTVDLTGRALRRLWHLSSRGPVRPSAPQASSRSSVARIAGRAVLMYVAVLFVANLAMRELRQTKWARDVRSGRAYRIPVYEPDDDDDNDDGPFQGIRSTLPMAEDVLIAPDYASGYYGSYSMVLEYAHPGNVRWRKLRDRHGVGFSVLSESLRDEFCAFLVGRAQWEEGRRFLKQDLTRHWVRVTDRTELVRFCRRELAMAARPLAGALLREVDSLRAESRYGRFHWTAMQDHHIPAVLKAWDARLLARSSSASPPSSLTATNDDVAVVQATAPNHGAPEGKDAVRGRASAPPAPPRPALTLASPPSLKWIHPTMSGKNRKGRHQPQQHRQGVRRPLLQPSSMSSPLTPEDQEPFPGAWLEGGDRVLVSLACVRRMEKETDHNEEELLMMNPGVNGGDSSLRPEEWSEATATIILEATLRRADAAHRTYTVRYRRGGRERGVAGDAADDDEGTHITGKEAVVDPDCVQRLPPAAPRP
jgi:hypothetical protein